MAGILGSPHSPERTKGRKAALRKLAWPMRRWFPSETGGVFGKLAAMSYGSSVKSGGSNAVASPVRATPPSGDNLFIIKRRRYALIIFRDSWLAGSIRPTHAP